MPELAPPRTHRARMAFLHSASQREQRLGLLPAWLSVRLYALEQQFAAFYEREGDLAAEKQRLYDRKQEALASLNMLIRHYWQGIRLQVRRAELPAEAFLYLGLNREGRNLRLVRVGEKLNAARLLVGGAEQMTSRGWTLHQQPAACEVEAAEKQAIALVTRHGQVADQLIQLRQAMKEKAEIIDRICRQIYRSIQLALFGRSAAEQRLILRHYGFAFRYRPDRDRVPRRQAVRTDDTGRQSQTDEAVYQDLRDRELLGHDPPQTVRDPSPKRQDPPSQEERRHRATEKRQFMRRLVRNDPYRRSKNRHRRSGRVPTRPPDPQQSHQKRAA